MRLIVFESNYYKTFLPASEQPLLKFLPTRFQKTFKKLTYCFCYCRCNYVYDGFGNLYKKTCGQNEVQYLIDPFGNPGADIVGQVENFHDIVLVTTFS